MRYIEKVSLEIPAVHRIKGDFELADLTIFIGRSNSGKTRILEKIFNKIASIKNEQSYLIKKEFSNYKEICKKQQIVLGKDTEEELKAALVSGHRQKVGSISGLSLKQAKTATSLRIIDPTITDFGTNQVKHSDGSIRELVAQGSGVHNHAQIFDKLHDPLDIVLIDEPEISQAPYGKIEILKSIIEELENKQIILATHDPTLINQYLIKKLIKDKKYEVKIYSFSGDEFKKIEFDSNHDPEIHVGYLSQTYSGKPVHLIVEGQTEFYAFQALLIKYCIANNISHFPKLINKISISYMQGSQWEIAINHLPIPAYYDVLILLDAEHLKEIGKKLPKDINHISSVNKFIEKKVNLITTITNERFDLIFKDIFGEECKGKPLGLSQKIWGLSNEEFKGLNFDLNRDTKLIKEIIEWCLTKAGYEFNKKPIPARRIFSREEKWEKMYQKVKEFFEDKNRWPSRKGSPLEKILERWCHTQRTFYKNKTLSSERIEKLNKISFIWKNEQGRKFGSKDTVLRKTDGYYKKQNVKKRE